MIRPMAFGVRHGEVGGAAAFVLLLLTGCTEPNPYLEDDGSAADSGSVTSTGPSMDSSGSAPTPSPTNTGTTTTGNNGSDTGELGCADQGMECIAAAPTGWTGPFAWLEADASRTVGCEAPFEDMQTQVFSDLDAPAASCDCTCGALEGAVCSGGQMIYHTGSNCGGLPQPAVNLNPSCNPHGGAGWDISGSFEFVPPTVTSGSCDPEPVVEIPDADFTTQHLACGSTFAEADCGAGQLCAPSPSDPYYPRWCVGHSTSPSCHTHHRACGRKATSSAPRATTRNERFCINRSMTAVAARSASASCPPVRARARR